VCDASAVSALPSPSPGILAFERRRLVVRVDGERPAVVALCPEELPIADLQHFALGLPDAPALRVADLPSGTELPAGCSLREVRSLLPVLPADEARLALRALHVVEWGRTHRFCGRCGAANEELPDELARRCPRCELTTFPRISPAIIVLVRRGDRVLLGRGNHLPPGLYSTLAGFVEPGETLEEAVRREIREEVGIELGEVRYFGSQPWPFPDSLMIGFTAEHADGELCVDTAEIAEAHWCALEELPPVPPAFSIARTLIDAWVRERGGDPARLMTWPG
jgi:NAD+ diphosphatase